MIAQASDDNIKVVPKMKTRYSDLCPELTEVCLGFTLIKSYLQLSLVEVQLK